MPLKNISANVGKDFNFTCPVKGIPIIHVSWAKPAFVKNTVLLNHNSTLYISNVTEHHKGQYTCTAENKYGVDSSSAWLKPVGEFHLSISVIALSP